MKQRKIVIILLSMWFYLMGGVPNAAASEISLYPLIVDPGAEEGAPMLPSIQDQGTTLSALGQIYVQRFVFEGNTAFTNEILSTITAEYEKRLLTPEIMQAVCQKLTGFYIDKGYVNSGVILPDQRVADGIITLKVIEGNLSDIIIHGNHHLRKSYIEKRLIPGREIRNDPLNVFELQQRLKRLEQDPRIDKIQSELRPGLDRGKAVLNVGIKEATPYRATVAFNNHGSPSLGGYGLEGKAIHYSLTGWGDTLSGRYEINDGLDEYSIAYSFPLTRRNIVLTTDFSRTDSVVVEEPFDILNIAGDTDTTGISLRYPLYTTVSEELAVSVRLENRSSKTYLLKEPFSFSSGAVNGESEVTVLRFSQEWIKRRLDRVIAARSIFNFGIDLFNPTIHDDLPDSKFFAFMFQFQWIQRLKLFDSQILISLNMQFSDDPLLSMEKFSIGGFSSVRGYRENYLTTDGGCVSSFEWRIPVGRFKIPRLSKTQDDGEIQMAMFGDYGEGWNQGENVIDPANISSLGMGLRWHISRKARGEFYWGKALRDRRDMTDYDLQDDGIHFQISADLL